MGSNLAFVISSRADIFIIGKFLGDHFTGIYSLAFTLATMPLDKIGTIFNHVAFPALSRTKDDQAKCRTMFLEMHRYLLFIAYPVLIGLAIVAEDLVVVLLTEKWLAVVPVLQALCIVNVVRVSGMLITPALTSRGKEKQALYYSVAGMIVLPAGFIVGVQFGLQGIALAWILVYPLLYSMLLRFLNADLAVTLRDLIGVSKPTLVATAAMTASVLLLQEAVMELGHGGRLAGGIVIGAVTYVTVFVVFYNDQIVRMREAIRALRS
jgi:O-antigen/teichoic acid export membrane protein